MQSLTFLGPLRFLGGKIARFRRRDKNRPPRSLLAGSDARQQYVIEKARRPSHRGRALNVPAMNRYA